MNEYVDYLLGRIEEVRTGFKDGEFGKEYYENTMCELIDCLAQFTILITNKYAI